MPEFATLFDPANGLKIEYSRATMQHIRESAIDGLMALPRIGMGIGGLLLGERSGGVIRLLNSLEIACSHADGPSFKLTESEKKDAKDLVAGVGEGGVLGFYCSKPHGAAALGDPEMALFRELCPQPHQIALVLRPSTVEPTRAAFFLRNESGEVRKSIEWEVEDWRPPEAEPEPEMEASEEALPQPPVVDPLPAAVIAAPPVMAPAIAEAVPETPREPPPPPRPPRAVPRPAPLPFPVPAPKKSRLGWILAAIACLALGAAAFMTRDIWNPRPPLTLTSTESDGNLAIRWNPEAFRGIDHASLSINDGGALRLFPLDRVQIDQGLYIYARRSDRVTARLSAGEISAIAVWFAPAPANPPPAPTDIPPAADTR